MHAVQEALRAEQTFELQNLGSAGVLHVTRCLMVEGRQVDVIIQSRYLRVDLYRVGSNILPIPRSFLPSFSVPPALLALNPAFGIYQDDHYGFAPTFGMSGESARLATGPKGEQPTRQETRLQLIATGRKSIENSFYNANANLVFSREKAGDFIQNLAIETNYAGRKNRRENETFSRQAFF